MPQTTDNNVYRKLLNLRWTRKQNADKNCDPNVMICNHCWILTFWSLPVTWCTNSLTFQQLYALPHTVFMCFVFIWEQTATCATYSINCLVFIAEMKSVYSTVRTGSLNSAVCAWALKVNIATTVRSAHTVFMCFVFIWEQTTTCVTYSINWLVFVTEWY